MFDNILLDFEQVQWLMEIISEWFASIVSNILLI